MIPAESILFKTGYVKVARQKNLKGGARYKSCGSDFLI